MIMHTAKYGTRKNECPAAQTVLLWIASAVAAVIIANWALVQSHAHPNYARRVELMAVREDQSYIKLQMNRIADEMREQTKVIIEMKLQWQAPPER